MIQIMILDGEEISTWKDIFECSMFIASQSV